MRPVFSEGMDTFRPGRVPQGSQPELRYRANPVKPRRANYNTAAWLMGGSMLAAIFTVCLRFGEFAAHPLALTIMLLVAVVCSVVQFAQRSAPIWQMLANPFIAIVLWFCVKTMATVTDPLVAFICLLPLATLATWWLSDRIATFMVEFSAAGPLVPRASEQEILNSWEQRTSTGSFLVGLAILVGCFAMGLVLLVVLRLLGADFLGSSLAVLLVLVLLVGTAMQRLGSSKEAVLKPAKLLWDSLCLWCTYDVHRFAPGMLRLTVRPLGVVPSVGRSALLVVCLCAASMALLPAARYFPLVYSLSGGWQQTVTRPEVSKRSTSDIHADFTDEQREYYRGLSADKRLKYTEAIRLLEYNDRYQTALSKLEQEHRETHTHSGEAWIVNAVRGLPRSPTLALWSLASSALLSIITPLCFFACVFCICYGQLMANYIAKIDDASAESESRWEDHVTTLQNSNDKIERNSLWLGLHDAGDYPVLLHKSILHEHAHILGDSGSGKTALGLTPMVSQLIRMSGRDATCEQKNRSSCVVIDLKGDPALFHASRIEAERAGLPFRWFTNQSNSATYSFNPFLQSHAKALTANQRAELLLEALGLAYGEGYGRGHFSRSNRQVLSRIMQGFEGSIESFADLYEFSQEGKRDLLGTKLNISKKEREDAGDVFAAIEGLASFASLNVTERSGYGQQVVKQAIDFGDVLKTPQVVYFYLPSSIEAATVREIGKLALFSLLSAAIQGETNGEPNNQVYLVIDEFQQIISENLEVILRQARSKRIACILANQTISDLKTAAVNLIPTVQANTRFKQFYATTDLDQQDQLIRASGETMQYVFGWEETGVDYDNSGSRLQPDIEDAVDLMGRGTWGSRLTRNDLISLTDDETLSVVHIPRGKGYSQFGGYPFVLQSEFHISAEQYEARMMMPWPQADNDRGSFVPGERNAPLAAAQEDQIDIPAQSSVEPAESKESAPAKSNQERMAELLDKHQSGTDQRGEQ